MSTLDIRLLGPLEVRVDGEAVTIPGRNARKVLAMLLDEANRPVQISGLIRGVWDDAELPRDPKKQIQNLVGEVRKAHGLLKDRLKSFPGDDAYQADIEETELDVLRCKAAGRRARELRETGDLDGAAAQLRGALAEWRGPALSGLSGRMVESIARTLDDDRLALLEQRFDVELRLGHHHQVLGELRQTARVHGNDQRFAAHLMLALHRAGQPSEAVKHFAELRQRLVDEFGIDPDPRLVDLNAAILRNDPALGAPKPQDPQPKPSRAPFTLPPTPARFTGRDREIQALDAALDAAEGRAGLAVVSGMGGVGKTSLALQWAHRVADRFPDGCFYFDLRGFDPVAPETGPGPALAKALRRLGVDQHQLPGDAEEQSDLYRTMLAGRRVLIVLDNARDAQQVRPLLPASAGSFAIVTSRNRLMGLIGLDGAAAVPLSVLTHEESTAVLGGFVADDLAESRAARRIIAVCAGLPLALCLVGAWAAANPDLPLSSLADRLESTGNVLRVLSSDDPTFDPRTVFSCSYQELGTRARRAFRLLGLHPGPDITAAAMGSLAALTPRQAEETLRELATVQLVHEHQPGRFITHDLLRAFAVERLEAEVGEPERLEAARRMLEHYLHTADRADALLASYRPRLGLDEPAPGVTPEPIGGLVAAREWFAAEYAVLLALVRLGVAPALDRHVWHLAWCLAEYAMARHRGQDMIDCHSAALAAARRSRDVFGEVVSLGYLATGLMYLGDHEAATVRLGRAMDLAEEHGMPWAKGFVVYGLSVSAGRDRRHAEAVEYGRRAREHFVEAGDEIWAFRTDQLIGWHSAQLGDLDTARTCFERMLSASQAEGIAIGEATAFLGFGYIAHREQRFEESLRYYGTSLRLYGEHGMEPTAAYVMEHIGDTRLAMGDRAAARAEWERAVALYRAHEVTADADRVRRKLDGEPPAA